MNIRQISYNYKEFAKRAYKIVVDIDNAELHKPTVNVDMPICADLKDVMADWLETDMPFCDHSKWLAWCKDINHKYPAALPSYYDKKAPVNPYVFIKEMSKHMEQGESIVTGNGAACVITFQTIEIKSNQRLFTNSGCAAMGYGFPASIGVAIARKGERVVCIDGDGSFQMNIQELQTVVYNHLNLKIIILNNNGYHSIRQTQKNLFQPPLVGVCDGNGLSFPDLSKIAWAYGLGYVKIENRDEIDMKMDEFMKMEGPVICEVVCDPEQNFEPKLSSKVQPDGSIVSPEIDDMYPFLPREEYEANKLVW
jgi:acetolactate synthase-1/2/3 large subunit